MSRPDPPPKCPCCGEKGWADIHIRIDENAECLVCGYEANEDRFFQEEECSHPIKDWVDCGHGRFFCSCGNATGKCAECSGEVTPVTAERLQRLWEESDKQARETRSLWAVITADDIGGFTRR